MFIKGAPDYLLERTSKAINSSGQAVDLSKDDKKKILGQVTTLAEAGLRTLAICV